jgi:glutamate 5-kinase
MVAVSLQASQFWILSDVAGLFDGNPKVKPDAQLIPFLASIPSDLESQLCSQSAGPGVGSGGMGSKIRAARMATQGGVTTAIAHGRSPGQIMDLANGICHGTWFATTGTTVAGRRSWIAAASSAGRVTVDEGARHALEAGKRSLLPAGIRRVEGDFEAGDIIEILSPDGTVFARGLSNYGTAELRQIQGRKTEEIVRILGSCPYHEVVHRDNLVISQIAGTANGGASR